MDGFLLIDKPVGLTSQDVVTHVKRLLNIKKIGHTGTLDPFATGLLILCIGKATKLAYLFQEQDKTYQGTMIFGAHYDTYDTTGKVMKEQSVHIAQDDLDRAIQSMIGTYDQEPPMYAAIKVDGKKLYQMARQGETIDRVKRPVTIHDFKRMSDFTEGSFDFSIHVSKGTYIRSVAVDLASKLNTLGALKSLRRIQIGKHDLKDAKTLDDVTIRDIISLDQFFSSYPSITLNPYMIRLVKNGIYLDERQCQTNEPFVVRDSEGHLIAYYEVVAPHTYKPMLIL